MPVETEGKIEMSISDWGKIVELTTDIKYIRMMLEESIKNYKKLDEVINGNGKPGIKQDVSTIKNSLEETELEVEQLKKDTEALKEKSSNTSYARRGLWEVVRWIGSGSIIALILKFWNK